MEARIQSAVRFAESSERTLASAVNKASALTSLAAKWDSTGRCQLQLGREADSQAAFRKATRWLWERVRKPSPGYQDAPDLKTVLELAILSGDREAERFASQTEATDVSTSLSQPAAAYFRALQAFSLGDEARARRAGDELTRIPDAVADKAKYYPRLGDAVDALLTGNTAAIGTAIDAILERHVHYSTKGHLRRLEAAFICLPATCLAVVGTRRGLSFITSQRFNSIKMKFPVISLEVWQGKPGRGLEFELEVNCLPVNLNKDRYSPP